MPYCILCGLKLQKPKIRKTGGWVQKIGEKGKGGFHFVMFLSYP
jgi:hypothetical protein